MMRWLALDRVVDASPAPVATRSCTSGDVGVAADPGEVELQRRQRAADVVVDLARDRRALHLDAGLQVLRQLGQPLPRRRELAVGEHARLMVAVASIALRTAGASRARLFFSR